MGNYVLQHLMVSSSQLEMREISADFGIRKWVLPDMYIWYIILNNIIIIIIIIITIIVHVAFMEMGHFWSK